MANEITTFQIDSKQASLMHFLTKEPLVEETQEYRSADEALRSPLAAKLFGFPWTEAVILENDRLSLQKADWVEWDDLAEPLEGLINAHFQSGEPIVISQNQSDWDSDEEINWSIHIESTPNPATLKFQANHTIANQSVQIDDFQSAHISPLAEKLFGFPWTEAVFIGQDFVSVTKAEWAQWDSLAEPLSKLIEEHLQSGAPVLLDIAASSENPNDSEEVKIIKKVLNEEIRPAVAMDGGDIVFQRYENQVVYLYMQGACSGCPSSTFTLKQGIQARLQEALPEIRDVVSI